MSAGQGTAGRHARPRVVLLAWTGATRENDPFVADFMSILPKTHAEGRVVFTNPRKNAGGTLAYLAEQRYDLIIVGDYQGVSAAPAVALDFPSVSFLLPDGAHESLQDQVRFLRPKLSAAARRALPRNVEGTLFRKQEAGYLAGYLAALMERRRPGRDVIGWVGGEKSPGVNIWIVGYEAGAKRADPGITIVRGYSGDFGDQLKCRRAALSEIARGAHVLFNVAGACGLGTLEVAKEKRVWGIGVDTDQSGLGPHILTSAITRVDTAMLGAIRDLERGIFRTGGNRSYGLREGGVGLGKISPLVPRSFLRKLDRVRRQIIGGEIIVPTVSLVIRHHS